MPKHPDLFSFQQRMEELSKKTNPLDRLDVIDWEIFRPILKKVHKTKPGQVGRKPYDVVLKFKILVLQRLHDLSDEQTEYQIKDRFSFMRFLNLEIHDDVPDENTIRIFREHLTEKKLIEKLFTKFYKVLENNNMVSHKGTLVDASFVEVPKQRNKRKENKQIKAGEVPEEWNENKPKLAQKDTDARWTQKNNVSYYGYKNHIRADKKSKLIEKYCVTSANVHDSQKGVELLKGAPNKVSFYADSAYWTPDILKKITSKHMKNKICQKGYRNRPLKESQIKHNRSCSKVRARVEHVFGDMHKFGGSMLRCIGIERAEFQIGMINLVYNMRRFAFLCR